MRFLPHPRHPWQRAVVGLLCLLLAVLALGFGLRYQQLLAWRSADPRAQCYIECGARYPGDTDRWCAQHCETRHLLPPADPLLGRSLLAIPLRPSPRERLQ